MAKLFSTLSGKEFLKLYPETKFYKITNQKENHNNFQYKDGINEDILEFNPSSENEKGGLYFTELNKIMYWIDYGVNIRRVIILDDSLVYIEKNKFKTNKFILDNKVLINEFEYWNDNDFCKLSIEINPNLLQYVTNQTDELCKMAIIKDPEMLYFVKNQTDELCKMAIDINSFVLQYVKNQTDELCKIAIEINPFVICFIKINYQTDELCKMAIDINSFVLQYVKNQTDELCKIAIDKNPFALECIKNQTFEICNYAYEKNPLTIQIVTVSKIKKQIYNNKR